MNKPKPIKKDVLNYYNVLSYIEEKYDINTSNYYKVPDQPSHFEKYQNLTQDFAPFNGNYPLNREGKFWVHRDGKEIETTKDEYDNDFKLVHEQYHRYKMWSVDNPEEKIEFANYDDYLNNTVWTELSNDTTVELPLKEMLNDLSTPDFVKNISELIYKEFSEYLDDYGSLKVFVSW